MARRTTRPGANGSTTALAVSLKHLVESVTERVWLRVRRDLISREEIRTLEREVRALARKVDLVRFRKAPSHVGRPRLDRKCKIASCGLPHVAQGFCSKHYQSWRRKQMSAGKLQPRPRKSARA